MQTLRMILASSLLAVTMLNSGTASASTLAAAPVGQTVYHIVAFRFATDAAVRDQIPAVVEAFADLQNQAVAADGSGRRLITSFHYGVNNSTEQASFGAKGVTADRSTEYDFVATFDSVADRDYYVNEEPHHQAFKKLVATILEDGSNSAFVTDFTN